MDLQLSEEKQMNNFMKLLGTLTIAVIIPLLVLLGIWAGILPQSLQVDIGMFGVISAIVIIVGGNLYLMYDDIKSGRYSKSNK
jgi:thiosulfate reductase cytochrome b subunit